MPYNGTGENTKGLAAEMKTFYDKTLIELAGPALGHDQFAQKRPIPRNGGKTIEVRKFNAVSYTHLFCRWISPALKVRWRA